MSKERCTLGLPGGHGTAVPSCLGAPDLSPPSVRSLRGSAWSLALPRAVSELCTRGTGSHISQPTPVLLQGAQEQDNPRDTLLLYQSPEGNGAQTWCREPWGGGPELQGQGEREELGVPDPGTQLCVAGHQGSCTGEAEMHTAGEAGRGRSMAAGIIKTQPWPGHQAVGEGQACRRG